MNIETLEEQLEKMDKHFKEADPSLTDKERVLSRVVKLNEEVGELCEATLYENDKGLRSKNKVIDFDEELADVLICTLLLANNRKVNIWDSVDKKLNKQFKRLNLN